MTRPSFALHNAFLLLVVVAVIVWLLNATVPAKREWLKILLDCQLAWKDIGLKTNWCSAVYVDFHVVRINFIIEQNM